MTALLGSAASAAYVLFVALASVLGTNLDTITALAPALWATRGRPAALRAAVGGCALGNALIVTITVLAASGLAFTPPLWSRWAGLIPMGLGLWRLRPSRSEEGVGERGGAAVGFVGCVVVTLSLGVDNVAVLAPLLQALSRPRAGVVVAVHLVLFPVLLVGVAALARLRGPRRVVAQPVAPCLTIAAGAAVLCRSLTG